MPPCPRTCRKGFAYGTRVAKIRPPPDCTAFLNERILRNTMKPPLAKFCVLAPLFPMLLFSFLGATAAACPQGQIDVVPLMMGSYFLNNPNAYMAADPAYINLSGFGNTNVYPQYGSSGRMWWSRGIDSSWTNGTGYGWDVSAFDSNYVYFAFTNSSVGGSLSQNPNYYRQYYDPTDPAGNNFWKITPRCVTTPQAGSPYSTILIPPSDGNTQSDTDFFNMAGPPGVPSCQQSEDTTSVNGADFQLWPPTTYTFTPPMKGNENIGSHPLMALVYRWKYDSSTQQYGNQEIFYFDQTYGWVAWTHQSWNGSGWNAPDQWNYMDQLTPGTHVNPGQPTCLVQLP
jgi:hypothetical protein